MQSVFKFALAGLIFSYTLGCVSTYKGEPPNFVLTGNAAKAEIEKFKFKEGYWVQGPSYMTMGPDENRYYLDSLAPVIDKTSPKASQTIKKADIWRRVQFATLGAALVLLAAELIKNDDKFFSTEQSIGYYSLVGTSIGMSFVRIHWISEAAEQYNRDLEKRFTPAIGLNIQID